MEAEILSPGIFVTSQIHKLSIRSHIRHLYSETAVGFV
jgi:hypothetical protein